MVNHSLTVSGSHIVRLYLWDKLQESMGEVWRPIGNNNAIPIIPAQEQPEFQTSEQPYMVYAYSHDMTTDLWQLQEESMAITMYSQSPARVAATGKLIKRIFNKWDESAQDVNAWIRSSDGLGKYKTGQSEYDQWIDEVENFNFKFIRLLGITGPQPAEGEGSRVDSTVSINMSYIEKEMKESSNNPK